MAIDLDKSRAARREARGEGPKVTFEEVTYELSPELPIDALEAFRGLQSQDPSALVDLAKALLGKHYPQFTTNAEEPITLEDLNELIGGIMGEYGVAAPLDSSAS